MTLLERAWAWWRKAAPAQMEALLGFALPATPNLLARTVAFERLP